VNRRWIVPVALALAVIEIPMGVAAYGSKTWNLSHTEVLTGWPAVREVCLVFVPLFVVPVLLGAAVLAAAISWAMRGGR
jgi:hypothetical protein